MNHGKNLKSKDTKQSEVLPIVALCISALALIASSLSVYFQFFHKPNNVSVFIEETFYEERKSDPFSTVVVPLVFINSGKRTNTITYAEINTYTKRYTHTEINPRTGERPHIISYHTREALEPFVLYPGDVLYKRVEINLSNVEKKHNNADEEVKIGAYFTTVTDNGKRIKSGLTVGTFTITERSIESSWNYEIVNLLESSSYGSAYKPFTRPKIDNQ